jgi:hypothetical protein
VDPAPALAHAREPEPDWKGTLVSNPVELRVHEPR